MQWRSRRKDAHDVELNRGYRDAITWNDTVPLEMPRRHARSPIGRVWTGCPQRPQLLTVNSEPIQDGKLSIPRSIVSTKQAQAQVITNSGHDDMIVRLAPAPHCPS